MSHKFVDNFKQLDAYAKTLEDFKVKTTSGAVISCIGAIVMVLLFLSEFKTYLSPNISEELFVDTARGHKLRINIDIVVPSISCSYLVLDAMDSSGEQHLQMEHSIHKRRLDLDGNPIDEPKKEEITTSTTTIKPMNDSSAVAKIGCGSCYGAALNSSQCCNTCDDVKEAYSIRRWALPDLSTIEQCKNDKSVETANNAHREGCQIYGHMEVNRVSGSFHIAPGKSFTMNHIHVHDVQPYSSSSFNTSHVIKHLSFGSQVEGANTSPLDGVKGIAKEGAVMFQYYIKIVPTIFVQLNNTVMYTNQFSVTRHQKVSGNTVNSEPGMPGAFFSYELSPLMVKYTEKERSIGHLATNICAIVGGVFTVAGIIDALFYHSMNLYHNKMVIGKDG